MNYVGGFGGLRIVQAPHALEATEERLFPESRHRSARVRKKLIRRHGGEFRMRPCIWRAGDTLYCHPARYAEIARAIP